MRIEDEFTVAASPDRAWELLTDLELVAECLPGATLTSRDGGDHHGTVVVKVGPMTASFAGTARFAQADAQGHRAIIEAQGREKRGGGHAAATVHASVDPHEDGSRVSVSTDLSIAGKLAQFGAAPMRQISTALLAQFAERLHERMEHDTSGADDVPASSVSGSESEVPRGPEAQEGAAPSSPTPSPSPTPTPSRAGGGPLDLVGLMSPRVRRAAVAGVLVALALVVLLIVLVVD